MDCFSVYCIKIQWGWRIYDYWFSVRFWFPALWSLSCFKCSCDFDKAKLILYGVALLIKVLYNPADADYSIIYGIKLRDTFNSADFSVSFMGFLEYIRSYLLAWTMIVSTFAAAVALAIMVDFRFSFRLFTHGKAD